MPDRSAIGYCANDSLAANCPTFNAYSNGDCSTGLPETRYGEVRVQPPTPSKTLDQRFFHSHSLRRALAWRGVVESKQPAAVFVFDRRFAQRLSIYSYHGPIAITVLG